MTAGPHDFDGNIYNLRLWDSAMTAAQLEALSCDAVGSVLDWDNRHWSIPSSLAQTDASLSCSEFRRPLTFLLQPMRLHTYLQPFK